MCLPWSANLRNVSNFSIFFFLVWSEHFLIGTYCIFILAIRNLDWIHWILVNFFLSLWQEVYTATDDTILCIIRDLVDPQCKKRCLHLSASMTVADMVLEVATRCGYVPNTISVHYEKSASPGQDGEEVWPTELFQYLFYDWFSTVEGSNTLLLNKRKKNLIG